MELDICVYRLGGQFSRALVARIATLGVAVIIPFVLGGLADTPNPA